MENTKNKFIFYFDALLPFVIIFFLAAVFSFVILGAKPLNIYDSSWLWGDLSQVNTAWTLFLNSSNSHGFYFNDLSYPLDVNVSLFDPMPIYLIASDFFYFLLPNGVQFFGFYFFSCLFLQGVISFLIARNFLIDIYPRELKNIYFLVTPLLISIFSMTFPFVFVRFSGHTALSSQWLIFLSFYCFIKLKDASFKNKIFFYAMVLFFSSGINPYLALMVFISFFISEGFHMKYKLNNIIRYIFLVLALGFTLAYGLFVFGFANGANINTSGYGIYSMNFLGLIDSNGTSSLLGIDIADATGGQSFEGFVYPGLGFLLLLIFSSYLFLKERNNGSFYIYKISFIILTVSFLISLSSVLSFNQYVFEVPLPDLIYQLISKFRASGRFFWLGMIWVYFAACYCVLKSFPIKKSILLFLAFMVIQIVDVYGVAKSVRSSILAFSADELRISNNDNLRSIDKILVFPPWQCDNDRTPGGIRNYEAIGGYAIKNHLKTNNFYAARTPQYQMDFHCSYVTFRDNEALDKKALYIMKDYFYKKYSYRFENEFDCNLSINLSNSVACINGSKFK